jgi:hypothetical protein
LLGQQGISEIYHKAHYQIKNVFSSKQLKIHPSHTLEGIFLIKLKSLKVDSYLAAQ